MLYAFLALFLSAFNCMFLSSVYVETTTSECTQQHCRRRRCRRRRRRRVYKDICIPKTPVYHVHFSFLFPLLMLLFFRARCMHRKWYEWVELVAKDGTQCVFMQLRRCYQFIFSARGIFFLCMLAYKSDHGYWLLRQNLLYYNNKDITCNFRSYFLLQYLFFFLFRFNFS